MLTIHMGRNRWTRKLTFPFIFSVYYNGRKYCQQWALQTLYISLPLRRLYLEEQPVLVTNYNRAKPSLVFGLCEIHLCHVHLTSIITIHSERKMYF